MNPIDRLDASRTVSTPSSRARPIDRDRQQRRPEGAYRDSGRARDGARCRSIVDRARAATPGRGDRPTDRPTDRASEHRTVYPHEREYRKNRHRSLNTWACALLKRAHIARRRDAKPGMNTPREIRPIDRPTRGDAIGSKQIECIAAPRRARRRWRWRRRWSNRWRTWRAPTTSCGTR